MTMTMTMIMWFLLTLFFVCMMIKLQLKMTYKKKKKVEIPAISAATLLSESSTHRAIATAWVVLESVVKGTNFIDVLREKMVPNSIFNCFTCRVSDGEFIPIEAFDPSNYVTIVAKLPTNVTPQMYAELRINDPFPQDGPLWECTVIEDYENKTYIVFRVHHCLGDGPAMVAACCTLCDNVDDLLIWGAAEGALRRAPVSKNMDEYYTALQVVLKKFMRLWLTREPITMLTHPGGIAKNMRYAFSLTVDQVRSVGRPFHATINDVMLCCVAGSLNRLLSKKDIVGGCHRDLVIRSAMPVSMRRSANIASMSNEFSSLLIELPIGIQNPSERLTAIVTNTAEAKSSFERYFAYAFAHFIARLPQKMLVWCVTTSTDRISLVVSNIRGPPMPVELCGQKSQIVAGFFIPPPGVNIACTIMSCGNALGVALMTDSKVIEDPDEFLQGIFDEFHLLEDTVKNVSRSD